jgi:hypothetical protein
MMVAPHEAERHLLLDDGRAVSVAPIAPALASKGAHTVLPDISSRSKNVLTLKRQAACPVRFAYRNRRQDNSRALFCSGTWSTMRA